MAVARVLEMFSPVNTVGTPTKVIVKRGLADDLGLQKALSASHCRDPKPVRRRRSAIVQPEFECALDSVLVRQDEVDHGLFVTLL